MQSPRKSHACAIKQILRYLKGTTSFGIKYNRSNDMKLVGYSDSSHNVDIDDGRSTTGHVFYLATAAACQAIWLRELLAEVIGLERQKVIIRVDNKSTIALSKNPLFHERSKHIHTRYHFIRECVENEQDFVSISKFEFSSENGFFALIFCWKITCDDNLASVDALRIN
ncbi:hypothetical protein Tco_1090425 [Tanacetum coccineum]|uniref:Uncharacterized protein n=1 Tax=Tanacetum coccineum TaxID=301880 RepID=A0ABQ5I465_9ASTR